MGVRVGVGGQAGREGRGLRAWDGARARGAVGRSERGHGGCCVALRAFCETL